MSDADSAEIAALYAETEAALPTGWSLDGLRCESIGLAPAQRSADWRAVARAPDGRTVEGHGQDPRAAIEDLRRRVAS